jgi:selenocysteine-specific elongation factor
MTYHIRESSYGGLSFSELWGRIGNVSSEEMRQTLERLVEKKGILAVGAEGTRYIHRSLYDALKREIVGCLEEFHAKSPMALGLSKEELKTKLPKAMGPRLFQLLLQEMIQTNQVILEKEKIRLAEHRISVREDLLSQVERTIRAGELTPPSLRELVEGFHMDQRDLRNHLELLVNRGTLVRIKGELYFHNEAISRLKEALVDFIRINGEITTPQFKDLTQISRKYAIPLLEYFDNAKVTIRVGDKRILRGTTG